MIHTEQIDRATIAYARLVNNGIFAYEMRESSFRQQDDWTIRFTMLTGQSRTRAKSIAETYLKDAHNATGILFYRRTSDKDNQFRAFFSRGDL